MMLMQVVVIEVTIISVWVVEAVPGSFGVEECFILFEYLSSFHVIDMKVKSITMSKSSNSISN